MYSHKELLSEFYTTADKTKAKIETKKHGFSYLEELSQIGNLRYSEWKNGVFKYNITDLKEGVYENLLDKHLSGEINLCIYFDPHKNNIFCFNLDSFTDDRASLVAAARFIEDTLIRLHADPLVLKSGHGYHFWCRLEKARDNKEIAEFMQNVLDVAVFEAAAQSSDVESLQCILYPRHNADDISIRLFGTHHSVNGRFISVVTEINTEDTVLGEEESWAYFEDYLKNKTIPDNLFSYCCGGAKMIAEAVK